MIEDFSAKKWIAGRDPTVTTLTAPIISAARQVRFPCGEQPIKRNPDTNKVTVMNECSTPAQIKACRALALERNRQLFEEAHELNRAANALLEQTPTDFERFEQYRALRKKADAKFEDAIDHLCVLNEDFPPIPTAVQNAVTPRRELEPA
ncbi:hypothetical protein [Pseudomonas atacamensis]|uniref:Phage protein n=1 Tax=Pseudomonas iranensis TaxID=2745503 RepID=A0AAU7F0I1_9PSED|nr:hypothetical protein [Pseudomonas atacamensis]